MKVKQQFKIVAIFAAIIFLSSGILFTQFASAHVLQTDGTLGGVLHIDPDDDPVTNQTSTFFLYFKDTAAKFNPQLCNCSYQLYTLDNGQQGTKLVDSTFGPNVTAGADNEYDLTFSYIFKDKGIYRLIVHGTAQPNTMQNSQQTALFKPFSLTYDIRVAREGQATDANGTPPEDHTAHAVIFGLTFLITFLVISQDKYNPKRVQKRLAKQKAKQEQAQAKNNNLNNIK